MTHKTNGIAQLFQMTINKFDNIQLIKYLIKYKLDPVFVNCFWQIQSGIQAWLVTSSPIPPIFYVGTVPLIEVGDCSPQSFRGAAPEPSLRLGNVIFWN